MIPEFLDRCKESAIAQRKSLEILGIVVLSLTLFLGLVRFAWLTSGRDPIRIEATPGATGGANATAEIASAASSTTPVPSTAAYFGSKTGKKYYPANCKSGARVKPVNRVYFTSEASAESSGYTLAAACGKGTQ